jgi:solute carrier family 13 (sodium-dependent dicarboxylate transporter), member 2/3/5
MQSAHNPKTSIYHELVTIPSMWHAYWTLGVLAVLVVCLATQLVPVSVGALSAALILCFSGIITFKDFYSALSNPTLLLFAGMFVVGAALFHTGLAQWLGESAVRRLGRSENRLLWITMIMAAVLSTFASNTGTTAALIPVVISVCATAGIPASRQLMPLAFTSGYGGFSTLIGTPPNIIVSDAAHRAGYPAFGFFEFAWLGIPLALAGMLYLTWASKRFLPQHAAQGESDHHEHVPATTGSVRHRWICGGILLAVIVVMALNLSWLPLEIAALIAALLCILTGCISEKQAFASIEWDTLFLFAGMFAVAKALENSGAASLLAQFMQNGLGQGASVFTLVTVGYFVTVILNSFISNTACAALLSPIAITVSQGVGAHPQPLLMAIAVGASCSFLTPVGTPPNTLVWKVGGYRFIDYARLGGGLVVVCWLVAMAIIPWKWPAY